MEGLSTSILERDAASVAVVALKGYCFRRDVVAMLGEERSDDRFVGSWRPDVGSWGLWMIAWSQLTAARPVNESERVRSPCLDALGTAEAGARGDI